MSKAEEIAYEVYPAHSTTSVLSSAQVDLMRIGFIKGYEQVEKDTIERACEWLEQALTHGCHPCSGSRLVMEFRKAMEEKK